MQVDKINFSELQVDQTPLTNRKIQMNRTRSQPLNLDFGPRRQRVAVQKSPRHKECFFCTMDGIGIFSTVSKTKTSFIEAVSRPDAEEASEPNVESDLISKMKMLSIHKGTKDATSRYRSGSLLDISRFFSAKKTRIVAIPETREKEKEERNDLSSKIYKSDRFEIFLNKKHHIKAISKLKSFERDELKKQINECLSKIDLMEALSNEQQVESGSLTDQKIIDITLQNQREKVLKVKKSFEKVEKRLQRDQDKELIYLVLQGTEEDRKLLSLHLQSICKMESMFLLLANYISKTALCHNHLFNLLSFLALCNPDKRSESCGDLLRLLTEQPAIARYRGFLEEIQMQESKYSENTSQSSIDMPPFLNEIAMITKRSKSKEKQFAKLLTELHAVLYNNLTAEDLSLEKWNGQNASALKLYNQTSKNIARFVVETILNAASLEHRAQLIRFYLNVCKKCLKTGDIATVQTIFHGLNTAVITRLTKSFSIAYSYDNNRVFFQEIDDLLSPLHNYKNLREFQKKNSSRNLIPAFPIFLKDYLALQEGGGSIDHGSKRSYNYEKISDLHNLIVQFLSWQNKETTKHSETLESPCARYFMHAFPELDEDALYEKSCLLESIQYLT